MPHPRSCNRDNDGSLWSQTAEHKSDEAIAMAEVRSSRHHLSEVSGKDGAKRNPMQQPGNQPDEMIGGVMSEETDPLEALIDDGQIDIRAATFCQGWNAAEQGYLASHNPYEDGTSEFAGWELGHKTYLEYEIESICGDDFESWEGE